MPTHTRAHQLQLPWRARFSVHFLALLALLTLTALPAHAQDTVPAAEPDTYPDPAGFAERRQMLINSLKDEDLSKWRKGYFAGGDPGKYLPGAAMAKLLADPDAQDVRKFMNDDRSPKEHYHFAAVNWARYLPMFGDTLTDETKKELAARASRYGYFNQGGTENHKTMWLTAANVLPWYLEGGRLHHKGKDAALEQAKNDLRSFVKKVYAAGNGEWDSSTYNAFTMHGLMNVYDFSKDPETKLIAKAGLDWFTAAYAMKYTDGLFVAPNQRGYADSAVKSITDHTGWLWWGSNATITTEQLTGQARYAMHAATSTYRPNAALSHIATRDLPKLPFESRNSKPNYYAVTGEAKPSQYHETVYVDKHVTMGTLWNGHGGQMTRFQIAVETDTGPVAFTGGHPSRSDHTGKPIASGFRDGSSRYAQFAAHHDTAICLAIAPDNAADKYAFFTIPDGVKVERFENWYVLSAGHIMVLVQPIGGDADIRTTEPDKRGDTMRYLHIDGQRVGFVVQLASADARGKDPADLARWISKAKLDTSRFAKDGHVTYTAPSGRTIAMTFSLSPADNELHGNQTAQVVLDGKAVTFGDWPVYDNPYIKQEAGVLSVNDGKTGFVVEFTGNLPKYKPYTP